MTPSYTMLGSGIYIFVLTDNILAWNRNITMTSGISPVINLKSDTIFEEGGEGTSTNPYVVIGT